MEFLTSNHRGRLLKAATTGFYEEANLLDEGVLGCLDGLHGLRDGDAEVLGSRSLKVPGLLLRKLF